VEAVQRAVKDSANADRSEGQVSLRYALHPNVIAAVIPGASRVEQLIENMGTADVDPLTEQEIAYLKERSAAIQYVEHRP
jgi:aryl-alcohol dehydrogenase-like predicted oxidoreductase